MNLKEKTVDAFLWLSSTRLIGQGFSWLVTIILARLLLPSDFGLIAMATLFIGFLDLVNEMGVGAAIVQKKDLDEDNLHSTFWFSVLLGLALYGFIFISAPTIAVFFESDRLETILRVLGLNFVIGSFKTIPYSTLTRGLAFDKRSRAELFSIFAGGLLSVILALSGYGVWSIVFGSLLQNLALAVFSFYFSQWRPKRKFSFGKVKMMLHYGVAVAGSRVLWYFYSSFDLLIIAKLLGDRLLGFYSMAFQLSTAPVLKITGLINQVAFPVYARLQSDTPRLQKYFLKITQYISLLTFPAMAGLFLVSEDLILLLLTEKWLPMLVPFKILCAIGVLRSVSAVVPVVLNARGKPYIVMKFNLISIVVLPGSFLIGIQYGITGVAWAWVMAYPCVLIYLYRYGLRELELTFSSYLKGLLPSFAGSVLMAVAVILFQIIGPVFWGENILLNLFGSIAVGIVTYLAYLLVIQREVVVEVMSILNFWGVERLKNSRYLSYPS